MSFVGLSRGFDIVINAFLIFAVALLLVRFITFVVLSSVVCGEAAMAELDKEVPQCCKQNGTGCRNNHNPTLFYSANKGCYCKRCKKGVFVDSPSP